MRVSVIGTSGSGKTTFAAELARRLGCRHIDLDAINWQAGWRDLNTHDPEEFRRRTAAAVADEAWTCCGNYSAVRDLVLGRATHLVWLDYPLGLVMARVLKRSLHRGWTKDELWPGTGNRETLRNQFLSRDSLFWWALKTSRRRRRELPLVLARPEHAHLIVHRFRRAEEATEWLERQPATAGL